MLAGFGNGVDWAWIGSCTDCTGCTGCTCAGGGGGKVDICSGWCCWNGG